MQVYEQAYNTAPTTDVFRFRRKEFRQQTWLLLLDDEFVRTYVHGFVAKWGDGISRRLFPRMLAYSADCPVKRVLYMSGSDLLLRGECP